MTIFSVEKRSTGCREYLQYKINLCYCMQIFQGNGKVKLLDIYFVKLFERDKYLKISLLIYLFFTLVLMTKVTI